MSKNSYEQDWKKKFSLKAKESFSDAEIGSWSEEGFKIRKKYFFKYSDLSFNPETKILDLGCGSGAYSKILAKKDFNVIGVDYVPEVIEIAKKRSKGLNIKYKVAEAYSLPFPESYFDVVISVGVFQHISSSESAIKEIKRVLKPGGKVFIITLNKFSLYSFLKKKNGKEDLKRYNPYKFKKDISEPGFSFVELKGIYITPFSFFHNIIFRLKIYKFFNLLFFLFIFFSHSFYLSAINNKKNK